jgi:DNA-binding PadR family transcriptional regulator
MAHDDDPSAEDLLPLPTATFHILVALAESDRHGYAIMQEVAARTSGETKLNPGTLYSTLHRLLEQGVIEEVSGPVAGAAHPSRGEERQDERRRHYRITPFGREVATLELERLGRMVQLGQRAGLVLRES